MAIVNGRLDIASCCSRRGANPNLLSKNGSGPLWATVDARWPERTWYPPASITEEKTTHLALLKALLDQGRRPERAHRAKPWYRTFHGDWANPVGATPFWLAAKANDVEAMRMLIAGGANPSIVRPRPASRRCRWPPATASSRRSPTSRPMRAWPRCSTWSKRWALDVNARDNQGYTPLHGAALTANHDLMLLPGGDGRRRDGPRRQHLRRREPGRQGRRRRHGRHGGRHGQRPARAQHAVPRDRGPARGARLRRTRTTAATPRAWCRRCRRPRSSGRRPTAAARCPSTNTAAAPAATTSRRSCAAGDTPACPACAATDLERLVSLFAVDSDGTRQTARDRSMAKSVKRQQDKDVADIELYKRHHH